MPSSVKTTPLMIPTGYEGLQQTAAQKRKLADAMLASGMQGPGPNATSWTQLLGSLAQTWAGKSMQNDATKLDAELADKIRSDYSQRLAGFNADAKTLDEGQMVEKYQGDSLLADALDPYKDAFAARLKDRGEIVKDGMYWKRKGDIKPGDLQANDMNSPVIYGPDGKAVLNPLKITASVASQGFPVTNPVTSMADPRVSGGASGQADPLQGLTPEERDILMKELQRRAGGGAPETNAPMAPSLPVMTKPPHAVTPDGKPVWIINGKYYDNPEGK